MNRRDLRKERDERTPWRFRFALLTLALLTTVAWFSVRSGAGNRFRFLESLGPMSSKILDNQEALIEGSPHVYPKLVKYTFQRSKTALVEATLKRELSVKPEFVFKRFSRNQSLFRDPSKGDIVFFEILDWNQDGLQEGDCLVYVMRGQNLSEQIHSALVKLLHL